MRRGLLAALVFLPLLQTAAAEALVEAGGVLSIDDARTGCPAPPEDANPGAVCTPVEFGELGSVAGHRFAYGTYRFADSNAHPALAATSIVIFERLAANKARAVIVLAGEPAIVYERPRLLNSGARVLLHIAGHESGTGNFNRERLYRWRAGGWAEVDVTSWLNDLARRLPAGYGAWKGVYPDYRMMTATTPLWRRGDGNACPTGGRADLRLGWQGDRIVLRAIRRHGAGECGEPLRDR